ncbi:glycosyltransferase family 2 protein [Acetoanaerobium sticklandii]|uniref:glycosyltransferase family 2 protein n=1 Tax=Acetoanaerobium sticklandii TaxID=1511 RepID=UPI003A942AC9
MKEPLVSVVIPVYNAENYIVAALESVINQSHKNIEIIVVDDCSTDNSFEVISEFLNGKDIDSIVEKVDENFGGPAGPRNIGIKKSSGAYIAFLDADDIWHPLKIETQLKYLKDSDYDFVSSLKLDFFNDDEITFVTDIDNIDVVEHSLSSTLHKNTIYLSTVLIKKTDFRFNEEQIYHGVEDYYLWISILKKGYKGILIKDDLIAYRVLENSLSRNKVKYAFKVMRVLKHFKPNTYLYYFLSYFFISYYRIIRNKLLRN